MKATGSNKPCGEFDLYVAVDWSGARQAPLHGLKVARCPPGGNAPELVPPPQGRAWTRMGIIGWLETLARGRRVLAGFDFSFSAPYVDCGAYFPGSGVGGDGVPALWKAVEKFSNALADSGATDLYAGDFCRQPSLAHFFLRPHARGGLYEPRLRVTEHRCREVGLGRAESLFHLIGPSQVGLGSLSGMRALTRLTGYAVWPFDATPGDATGGQRSVAVELYTRLFLQMAGAGPAKISDFKTLNRALAGLNSEPCAVGGAIDDHASDAIVAAAGLRFIAGQKELWNPPLLSDNVRRTEGWTFGVP